MSKTQSFSQGGAWDRTGNSKGRFILEKLSGTHICSERGERIGAFWAWTYPRDPEMGPPHAQLPLLAALSPGPKALGSTGACSKGQASKSRDFTCAKLKIERFQQLHFISGRAGGARLGRGFTKSPRKPETCP